MCGAGTGERRPGPGRSCRGVQLARSAPSFNRLERALTCDHMMIGIVRRARTRRAEAQRLQRQRPRCRACKVGSTIVLDACRMSHGFACCTLSNRLAHSSSERHNRPLSCSLSGANDAGRASRTTSPSWMASSRHAGRSKCRLLFERVPFLCNCTARLDLRSITLSDTAVIRTLK